MITGMAIIQHWQTRELMRIGQGKNNTDYVPWVQNSNVGFHLSYPVSMRV